MCSGIKAVLIVLALILVTLLLLIFIPMLADAGEIHGNVELGRDPETPNAYVEINLQYEHTWLKSLTGSLFGGTECWFRTDLWVNYPFLNIYKIGYRLTYKDSLYIEWKHSCPHAVYSTEMMEGDFERAKQMRPWINTIAVGYRW